MTRFRQLLDARHLMLLRATMGEGKTAIDAFLAWRASQPFEGVDDIAYRLMPLLVATADRAGLKDADSRRMRGVVKHIWLSNMSRLRDLIEARQALDRAGIDCLLMKGGALFARDESHMAQRTSGDYDLQVRRKDATRAVATLLREGFHSLGMQIALFAEADFDRGIHAVAITKGQANTAIDLHWRPLITLHDEAFVEEMFATAESRELLGNKVMIPRLTEHLFLALVRPEPHEGDECLLRAVEVAYLVRNYAGQFDWGRLKTLVTRHGGGWIAAPLLALVQEEAGAPVPAGLVGSLWQAAPPGKSIELSLRSVSEGQLGPWRRWLLAFLEALRSEFREPFSWRHVLTLWRAGARALERSAIRFPLFKNMVLKRLWRRGATAAAASRGGVSFDCGFSVPEQGGRWTDDDYAVLHLDVDAVDGTVPVELVVTPFLPPGRAEATFVAYAGVETPSGVKIARGSPIPFKATFQARVTAPRLAVIALRMCDAARPLDIGHSVDGRLLGLFVHSVRACDDT